MDKTDEEKWYRKPWMNDDQWECYRVLASVFGGFHHIDGEPKRFAEGIEVNTSLGCWSTFDHDDLTRLVFTGHDHCIRFEVRSSGPRMLKLCAWKRHTRTGQLFERHPTLEEAVTKWRESNITVAEG